jgi:hypothetical protein
VLAQPPVTPIIRIVEAPTTGTGVADVLLGIVGLVGVLMVGAVIFGLLTGGVLVALNRLKAQRPRETHASEDLYAALHGHRDS